MHLLGGHSPCGIQCLHLTVQIVPVSCTNVITGHLVNVNCLHSHLHVLYGTKIPLGAGECYPIKIYRRGSKGMHRV